MLHNLLDGCETLEQIEARRDDAANGGDWFDGYDKNPGLMIPLLTLAACTVHRIRTGGNGPVRQNAPTWPRSYKVGLSTAADAKLSEAWQDRLRSRPMEPSPPK